jgi:S1-C subfamily serine protease
LVHGTTFFGGFDQRFLPGKVYDVYGLQKTSMKLMLLLAITLLPLPVWTQTKVQAPSQGETGRVLSPEEVFRRVSPSVFVVESLNSKGEVLAFGSGVAVKIPTKAKGPSDLLVVTNKHVIYGAVTYRIRKGEQTWKATLMRLDQGHDLCGLQPEAGWSANPITVRVSSSVKVGERTYAIGAPEGLELTLSEGLVSGIREIDDVRVIQTSAPISHGSSGGGLFDSEGRLIGITTFFLREGQNLNFALPGEWVLELGEETAVHFPASASGSQLEEARNWSDKGFTAYLNENYAEAVQSYKEAVRLDPEDVAAWFRLGEAQQKLKRDDEAVKSFHQATRLRNDDARPWERLALSYIRLRKYDDAIDAANRARTLDADSLLSWASLTAAYLAAGKCTEALNTSQTMLLLFPDDRKAQALSEKIQAKCRPQ